MWLKFKPSNWEVAGCSYQYNGAFSPWNDHVILMKKPVAAFGVGDQSPGWIPEPSRYILMFEPPALKHKNLYVHWHYARGKSDVPEGELQHDTQRFISPILFTDGHAASHDFTKALKTEPDFPYEPTANWMWYKPVDGY